MCACIMAQAAEIEERTKVAIHPMSLSFSLFQLFRVESLMGSIEKVYLQDCFPPFVTWFRYV